MFAPGLVLLAVLVAIFLQPIVPPRRRSAGRGASPFPWVTLFLMVVNVAVFFLAPDSVNRFGLWPGHPDPIRLLTFGFVHADLLHLTGNLVALALVSPLIEGHLGPARYLCAYLGSSVAAGLAHLLFVPVGDVDLPLAGASGALFGLLGLLAVRFWGNRIRVFGIVPMTTGIAVSLVVLVQALMLLILRHTEVAYGAHLGGAAFGVALAFPMRLRSAGIEAVAREDAELAAATGQWELAAAHYRDLVAQRPDDPGLRLALGAVCLRLSQDEAAARHLSAAIVGYTAAGDAAGTIRSFETARANHRPLEIAPNAFLAAATACEDTGRESLALHALSETCRLYPDRTEAQTALLRLARMHLRKLNQPRNAVALLTEFVRIHPNSPFIDHARALLSEAEKVADWGMRSPGTDSPCC